MTFEFIQLPEMTTAMAYGSPKGPTLDDLKALYCAHNQVNDVKYYFTSMTISKNNSSETLFVLYALMEPTHSLPKNFQKLVIKPFEYVKIEVPKEDYEEAIINAKGELDQYVHSHGKGITVTQIFFLLEDTPDHLNVYFPVKS